MNNFCCCLFLFVCSLLRKDEIKIFAKLYPSFTTLGNSSAILEVVSGLKKIFIPSGIKNGYCLNSFVRLIWGFGLYIIPIYQSIYSGRDLLYRGRNLNLCQSCLWRFTWYCIHTELYHFLKIWFRSPGGGFLFLLYPPNE